MTISLLGMTAARRRIFKAGIAAQETVEPAVRQEAVDLPPPVVATPVILEPIRAPALDGRPMLDEPVQVRSPAQARRVVAAVAQAYGVRLDDLLGPGRYQPLARIRHEAMWRLIRLHGLSWSSAGRALGDRDHTTIIHGVRAHERRMREAVLVIMLALLLSLPCAPADGQIHDQA